MFQFLTLGVNVRQMPPLYLFSIVFYSVSLITCVWSHQSLALSAQNISVHSGFERWPTLVLLNHHLLLTNLFGPPNIYCSAISCIPVSIFKLKFFKGNNFSSSVGHYELKWILAQKPGFQHCRHMNRITTGWVLTVCHALL